MSLTAIPSRTPIALFWNMNPKIVNMAMKMTPQMSLLTCLQRYRTMSTVLSTRTEHFMIRRSTYPPAGGGRWGRAVYPLGSHPHSRTFLMVTRPAVPTFAPPSALWYPVAPAGNGVQWSPSDSNRFQFYHPTLQMHPATPQPSPPPPLFSSIPQWYQSTQRQQHPLTSMLYPSMQDTYAAPQLYQPELEGYTALPPSPLYVDTDEQTRGDFEFQLHNYQKTTDSSSVPIIYAMPSLLTIGGIQNIDEIGLIGQPFVSRTGRKLMSLKPTESRGEQIFEKLTRGHTGAQIEEMPESGTPEMSVDLPDLDPLPPKVDDLTLEDLLRKEQELPSSISSELQPANEIISPPLKRRKPPLIFPQHGYFTAPFETLEPPRQGSLIPFFSGMPFSKPSEGELTTLPSPFLEPPTDDGPHLFTLPIPTEIASESRSAPSEQLKLPEERPPATFRETSELEEYLAKRDEMKIPSRFLDLPTADPAPAFDDKRSPTSRLGNAEITRTADSLLALVRGLELKEF